MTERRPAFELQTRFIDCFIVAAVFACGGSPATAPTSPAACAPSCTSSQACDLGQNPPVCVDLLGAITVTDNPAANSNGFYPRSAAVSIPVTVVLNAGSGTVSSATLSAGSVTGVVGTNTSGNTWAFTVPTTAQTPGSETPLQFTISATTAAGTVLTATEPATAPALKIDDKGPTVSAVTVVGGVAGLSDATVKWFKVDPAAKLSVQATIVDSGSGFDASIIQLQRASNGTRVDDGAPTAGAGGVFTFHVPQNLVAAGAESTVAFQIVATDHLSHTQSGTNTGTFGLDGKPPVLTFSAIPYPAARTGCSADTTNVFCGHDGAHFWRSESGTISFTATDGGVGVDGASGTCTVQGATTCTATFAGGSFSFPIDFSKLTVTTDPKGNFTVPLSMAAKDLVGNTSSSLAGSVDMTRVKWVRKLPNITNVLGAPIVSPQLGVTIVAGNVSAGDPIAAVNIGASGGDVVWTTGGSLGPAIVTVTNNMALDTTASADVGRPTPVLYVSAGNTAYALHITVTGVDKYCVVNAPSVVGAPTILGAGATAQGLVSTGTLLKTIVPDAMTAAGGACDDLQFSFGTTTNPKLGPPSANGSTIFVGYDNSLNVANDVGLASVTLSGNTFSNPQMVNLGFEPSTNGLPIAAITPAANLFFGDDQGTRKFYEFSPLLALTHSSSPAFTLSQRIFNQPTVSGALVFGPTTQLIAYNVSDMSVAWASPASAGAVSSPAIGNAAVYTSQGSVLHAIDSSSHTDQWTYAGTSASTPSTVIAGATTEPTLTSDGTIYFGDANGKVYAVITDTPAAPTATGDWPRTGFDNCNSNHANNAGFACQ